MKKPKLPYPLPTDLIEKFQNQLGTPPDEKVCWLGPKCTPAGDPYICYNKVQYSAGMVSFKIYNGDVPHGVKVAHTCNNRSCVNPQHLVLGQPRATTALNLRERFYEKTKREAVPRPNQTMPCLIWTGTRNKAGYGTMVINRKRKIATHVAILVETGEAVPKGKIVMHHCDNSQCVEFTHISVATTAENIEDRRKKGRTAHGEKHGTKTKPESVRRGTNHGMHVFSEEEVILIRRTYDAHNAARGLIIDLTRFFGKSRGAVESVAKRKSWHHVPDTAHPEIQPVPLEKLKKFFKKWPKGDAHKLTKVSDLQVREIRFLAKQNAGRTGVFPALAKRYGVSRALIRQICKRTKRNEIPDNFDELAGLAPLFSVALLASESRPR